MLAGWIDAESQKNREKEVGIEGQMERQMIGVGGCFFFSLLYVVTVQLL